MIVSPRYTLAFFALVVIGILLYASVFLFGYSSTTTRPLDEELERASESSNVKAVLLAAIVCGLPLLFDGLFDFYWVKDKIEISVENVGMNITFTSILPVLGIG